MKFCLGVSVESGWSLIFVGMFVRRKPNRNGTISVQIIDKSTGKYAVHRTVGSSKNSFEIEALVEQGKREIVSISQQSSLPFNQKLENEFVETFMNSIDSFFLVGPELLLGRLFDAIGGYTKNVVKKNIIKQI